MATLILAAGTSSAITVTCQRIGKAGYRYIGSKSYSFQGAERSSIRGQARIIPVLVSFVDTATEASIQAAIYNGAQIACSGDILANIQTQCSVTCDKSDMIPGLPGFFEMALTVTEIQASVTLLKYTPGNTVTGEAFTRSTTAYQTDVTGVLVQKAINAKRDGHYETVGGTRSLLLEGSRTNLLPFSEAADDASYTKLNITVNADVTTAADGNVTADRLAETATTASHALFRTIAGLADNGVYTLSAFFKAEGRGFAALGLTGKDNLTPTAWFNLSTGLVGTTTGSPTATRIRALGNGWYRCSITTNIATGATPPTVNFFVSNADGVTSYAGTAGTGIFCWGRMLELGVFPSSYTPTTTVAVTRGADSYSLPFAYPPQELSVYEKFVELGTAQAASGVRFSISDAAGAVPYFGSIALGGFYSAQHNNSPTGVSSALVQAPTFQAVDELLTRLYGDGSVDETQSVASAAATASTQSAANAPATAWSGQLVWLNAGGIGNAGFTALQSFKVVAGCRSLVEMRAA